MKPEELRAQGVLVRDMLMRGIDPNDDADRECLFDAVAGVLEAFGEHLAKRESATAVEIDFAGFTTESIGEAMRRVESADIPKPEVTSTLPEADE